MARTPIQRLTVDERRTRLLEVGIRVFSEHAFDEIGIDEIAREAGVSKGLLYHYFDGKRGYYVETIRELARRIEERTAPEPDAADPVGALARALRRFLDFVEGNASIYVALFRGGIGTDPEVGRIVEGVRRTSAGRIAGVLGLDASEPRTRTRIYGWVGHAEFAVLDWLLHRDLPADDLLEMLLEPWRTWT